MATSALSSGAIELRPFPDRDLRGEADAQAHLTELSPGRRRGWAGGFPLLQAVSHGRGCCAATTITIQVEGPQRL